MLGRNGMVVVFAALAVGGVAGWFAEGAWGKSKCENGEVCKCVNVKVCKCENGETANDPHCGGRRSAKTQYRTQNNLSLKVQRIGQRL